MQIASLARRIDNAPHAAADQSHMAAVVCRDPRHGVNAGGIGREGSDNDAPTSAADHLIQTDAQIRFRPRAAFLQNLTMNP